MCHVDLSSSNNLLGFCLFKRCSFARFHCRVELLNGFGQSLSQVLDLPGLLQMLPVVAACEVYMLRQICAVWQPLLWAINMHFWSMFYPVAGTLLANEIWDPGTIWQKWIIYLFWWDWSRRWTCLNLWIQLLMLYPKQSPNINWSLGLVWVHAGLQQVPTVGDCLHWGLDIIHDRFAQLVRPGARGWASGLHALRVFRGQWATCISIQRTIISEHHHDIERWLVAN